MDAKAIKALQVAKTELLTERERIDQLIEHIDQLGVSASPVRKKRATKKTKKKTKTQKARASTTKRMKAFHDKAKRRQFTPAQRKQILAKVAKFAKSENVNIADACKKVGISESLYYRWKR